MFQWERTENVLGYTKKIKRYIKSIQVSTRKKHGKIFNWKLVSWAQRKVRPIWSKNPIKEYVFKVTTIWHHQRHHLMTSRLHHHKWLPSFYNQRKLLKLFLVIKAYDIIIWHQDDINTSYQVSSKLIQLTNSWLSLLQASNSANKASCSYWTFWERSTYFKEEKWNQLKLWTATKNVSNNSIFTLDHHDTPHL